MLETEHEPTSCRSCKLEGRDGSPRLIHHDVLCGDRKELTFKAFDA
jgi:hypothetical protein